MKLEEYRKCLHQIPELGRCEFQTKSYLVSILEKLNCRLYYPTPTAVVAYFDLNKKKTLCFRADMDALQIEEQTGLSFASKTKGLMHACGHDGHMSILLGFAEWVSEYKNQIPTNVVCLFQPSEEDEAGASDILKSGILKELKVDEIYGLHLWPMLKPHQLYAMPFGMLAAATEIDICFNGKTVHAANRTEGIDAILQAATFLKEIYHFSDLFQMPHLLSFGSIEGSGARNAVCSQVYLKGTLRTFDDESYNQIKERILELKNRLEAETGVQIEVHFNQAYPYVKNDEVLYEKYKDVLSLVPLNKPFLQAEDFGCYTQSFPCLFLLLGIGDEHLLHTPTFDFPMEVLSTGVEAFKLILLNS